jgi:exosortase
MPQDFLREMENCGFDDRKPALHSAPMSDPAHPPASITTPDIGEVFARFGRWCARNPVQAALLAGVVGTLVWFYCGYKPLSGGSSSFFRWAQEGWNTENDLEHGGFILPGAIVVAWLHRRQFAEAKKAPSWLGLVPLAVGQFLFVVAVWTLQARLALIALPFLTVGCVWCLWGWPVARVSLFPCALLFFMVPVGFLLSHTEPLQRLVASVVAGLSNLVGIGVDRDGVKLLAQDGSFQCEVAGGCSGIRSIMAMTLLSFIYVHFNLQEPWKKLLTFAMTLPFAVIGNIVRVFTIVLASKWFGEAVGTGPWHNISGFVVTIPIAVGAMILFGDLLNRDWSGFKETLLAKDEPARPKEAAEGNAPEESAPASESKRSSRAKSPISYDY